MSNADVTVTVLDLDAYLCMAACMDAADITAADRVRDPVERRRFLTGRVALRELLSPLAGYAPDELSFRRSRNGKPALTIDAERGTVNVQFSVARRGQYCAVATSRTHPVGVDTELISATEPVQAMIEQFLPAPARAAVMAADPDTRSREFTEWWCRIEASVKLWGRGLDGAADCLAASQQQVATPHDGLAVAVAVPLGASPDVAWSLRGAHSTTTCDDARTLVAA